MNPTLPLTPDITSHRNLAAARSLRPAIQSLECVQHATLAGLAGQWPPGKAALIVFCPRHPRHPTHLVPIDPDEAPSILWRPAQHTYPNAGLVVLSPAGIAYLSGFFSITNVDATLAVAESIATMRTPPPSPTPPPQPEPSPTTTYPDHNTEAADIIIHASLDTHEVPF